MASKELEERDPGGEDMEQREEPERQERQGGEERPRLVPVALRGAAGGAAAGAILGAAVAIARALRPEEADAVQEKLVGASREIGTAAVRAGGGVLTAKPVADLIAGTKGKSDRGETVRQAAKEAGVAAASAAREALVSMRDESGQNGQ
jgi:hypothetical protein